MTRTSVYFYVQIAAMVEAKVKDDMIIRMLQKYWDLRLSEATEFLEEQKMDKK